MSIDLQEMINDGENGKIHTIFHNQELVEEESSVFDGIEDENYVLFVMYAYFLSTMLFVKFKAQLQMNKNLNNVITLIEESLGDAAYFLAYYALLLLFFVIHFMILGSVIIGLDYPGIDEDSKGNPMRYPYYIIQNFRNSVGDF